MISTTLSTVTILSDTPDQAIPASSSPRPPQKPCIAKTTNMKVRDNCAGISFFVLVATLMTLLLYILVDLGSSASMHSREATKKSEWKPTCPLGTTV
jgi:hypothetical protein